MGFLKNSKIFMLMVASAIISSSCSEKKDKERPSPLRAVEENINGQIMSIQFSSPGVKKREIWGELVPYDQMWRTGANEATQFYTSEDIQFQGQALDSGRYALFTIPSEKDNWKFILNTHWDQWGTVDYDSTKNALELDVIPRISEDFSERMKFYFEDDSLKFHWEKMKFSFALE